MSFYGGLVVYIILWWITVLCVLPWGSYSQSDQEKYIKGSEYGAPVHSHLKKKMIVTSLIAFILWCGVWALFHYKVIDLSQFGKG